MDERNILLADHRLERLKYPCICLIVWRKDFLCFIYIQRADHSVQVIGVVVGRDHIVQGFHALLLKIGYDERGSVPVSSVVEHEMAVRLDQHRQSLPNVDEMHCGISR